MQTNENAQTGICISTQAISKWNFVILQPKKEYLFRLCHLVWLLCQGEVQTPECSYESMHEYTSSNAFQQNFVILQPMVSRVLIGKICYIYLSCGHHQEGIFVPQLSPSMVIVSKIGPVSITLRCWRYCYVDTQILLRRYKDTVMQIRRYCYVDMQILSLDTADIVNTVDTVPKRLSPPFFSSDI